MKLTTSLLLVVAVTLLNVFSVSSQETARLQVIHNAADPAAEKVDIYLNSDLLLDDFAFRAATPFINAPANQEIEVGVAPNNSTSSSDIIATFKFNLMPGEKYIAVANGVLSPGDFAPNPDGKDTGFNIYVKTMAQEESKVSGNVEFAVMHGSTDAPTVDIVARNVATLVDNAPYPAITDYLSVPPADYTIDVKDETGTVVVATFVAPLSGLADGAAFVFASGFLSPATNQDGAPFGIFAALPDGTVLELPALTTARLQVIHNAADPAAEMVDIYLNGGLLLDDFAFRAATPFIDAPANQEIEVGVAPKTSTSSDDIIATFKFNLLAGDKYVAIANGVLDPSQFAVNPDDKNIGFNIFVKSMAREQGTDRNVDFFIFHGSTDAPAVDVAVHGDGELAKSLAYGEMTDYLSVKATRYLIILKDAGNGSTIAGFHVDLRGLEGGSAVVLASGFVNKDQNQGGEGFALLGILTNGLVVNFPDPPVTDVEDLEAVPVISNYELEQNYPNPFNPTTSIAFSLAKDSFVKLQVYNMLGQEVVTLINNRLNAGRHSVVFDASELNSGTYLYRIEADNFKAMKKMTLIK